MHKPTLLYAVPTGAHPHPGFALSVHDITVTCTSVPRRAGDFQFMKGPVQMARSKIVDMFLEGTWDYLLMHDDDLTINPHARYGNPIDRFMETFEQDPKIGAIGLVYLRENPTVPTLTMWHPDYQSHDIRKKEMVNVVHSIPLGIFECAAVGTGWMMIRRDCLITMTEMLYEQGGGPMFRFPVEENRHGLMAEMGEDYDFCRRVQAAGYKVFADSRIPTIHHKDSGRLSYDWHSWENQGEIKLDVMRGTQIINVNGLQCLDVSKVRDKEAEEFKKRIREQRATATLAVAGG